MRLLCISDIHSREADIAPLLQPGPDLIVLAGDITHLGGADEARTILRPFLHAGPPIFAVPGNMDLPELVPFLEERRIDLHGRGRIIDTVGFMGLGGSNRTPFPCPFVLEDEEILSLLEAGYNEIEGAEVRVLVSHPPPYGTRLDRSLFGRHVGSRAVRDFLESHSLHLCLSGHIHESLGVDRLGGTVCVNVGAFKDGRYAVVNIDAEGLGEGREDSIAVSLLP
jgi:Icc-related predicted phosphoesterase